MQPIPTTVGKDEAVRLIAEHLGLRVPGKPDPGLECVMAAFGQGPAITNAGIAFCGSTDLPGLEVRTHLLEWLHPAPAPDHRNGTPKGFEGVAGGERSPALKVLAVTGGAVGLVGHAPVVLPATCDRVIAQFSSGYARLLHAYDWRVAHVLEHAKRVPGDLLVLCDDVWPLNYAHWLLDELPRLACLGDRRDLSVLVSAPVARFQRETLERVGFASDRIVTIEDFSAVRADRLLVTCDVREMPHPAFKGADWALQLLRSKLPYADPPTLSKRNFYVSRNDAPGRHLRDEGALMDLLRPLGYDWLTLDRRSVAEQALLFGAATHIVGLHGAGLANLAFAHPCTQVIELFPIGYGTPAFYVIATALGCRYATYVADGVVEDQKERDQVYDARLDLDRFDRACGKIL